MKMFWAPEITQPPSDASQIMPPYIALRLKSLHIEWAEMTELGASCKMWPGLKMIKRSRKFVIISLRFKSRRNSLSNNRTSKGNWTKRSKCKLPTIVYSNEAPLMPVITRHRAIKITGPLICELWLICRSKVCVSVLIQKIPLTKICQRSWSTAQLTKRWHSKPLTGPTPKWTSGISEKIKAWARKSKLWRVCTQASK